MSYDDGTKLMKMEASDLMMLFLRFFSAILKVEFTFVLILVYNIIVVGLDVTKS